MSTKSEFFQSRIEEFKIQCENLKSVFNKYSLYRIALFILFVVFALVLLNLQHLPALLLLIVASVFAFGKLVNAHAKIKKELKLCQNLVTINREELSRLDFNFDGIWDGAEFAKDKHPYSSDLDIFGRNSLFQMINRAGTRRGIRLLANWLMKPSGKQVVEMRQQAVKELSAKLDWRQKFQANARGSFNKKENEEEFFRWLAGKDVIINRFFYRVLPYIMMLFSTVMIVVYAFELIPMYVLLLPFIISGYFLFRIIEYSRETYEMTQSGVRMLASIEQIVRLIEENEFEHEYLKRLRNRLMPQKIVASEKISELRKVFDWLSTRGNQFYLILNSIFLLDFILLAKAEAWRRLFKDEISGWFDSIAEIEALNSLAAFSFANSQYTFPEINDQPFTFHGRKVGHPLIPPSDRVDNDFTLSDKGSVCVITGSNMAGKSTFLRTIGINAVMAFSGAPVCAEYMSVSEFQVFTSMRTKDNLEENISSFYAELLRLKMLLERVNEQQPIMYFLDEILKGTNSVDRHIGAESLILQLSEMNVFGLVSTHDLKLGELEKSIKKIRNYHFSSSIIREEIVFDYKLREGICESTNASQLMAKIGINIKPKP